MSAESRTGPKPHPPRIGRLRARMAREGLDAIVSFKPENSFYLSGFNPIIYSHPVIAVLPREGAPMILVHALRDDHARASSFVQDVRLYGAWSTKVTMGPHWQDALGAMLAERGLASGTLGIEEEFVPVARMRELARALPEATFRDVSGLVMEARLVKDPDEIASARAAARIADAGMDAAIAALRGGGSERAISLAAMAAMNRLWSEAFPEREVCDFGSLEGGAQNGLWAWALSGERMFMNCDNPTERVPRPGETVSLLIWAVVDGLHAENERTVMMGEVDAERRRALETVLAVRADVARLMRPGTPISALFEATRAGFEAAGYGQNIPGRIGHGIGLGAHEHPSLDARTTIPLEPGMMFTLEPNLRVPGRAATQISDTVLITEGEPEFLTRSVGGLITA